MGRRPTPLQDRFWPKVDKRGPDDCWNWLAGKSAGYGVFRPDPKKNCTSAHIVAWELANGPVPDGMQLDHRVCRNKACVNPNHLLICTPVENWLQPDGCAGIQKAKTHCDNGHPFEGDNLLIYSSGPRKGRRACRACAYAAYKNMVANGTHAARVRRWRATRRQQQDAQASAV